MVPWNCTALGHIPCRQVTAAMGHTGMGHRWCSAGRPHVRMAIARSVDVARVASVHKRLEKQSCCHQYTRLYRELSLREHKPHLTSPSPACWEKWLLPAIQTHCGMNLQYFKLANTEAGQKSSPAGALAQLRVDKMGREKRAHISRHLEDKQCLSSSSPRLACR